MYLYEYIVYTVQSIVQHQQKVTIKCKFSEIGWISPHPHSPPPPSRLAEFGLGVSR